VWFAVTDTTQFDAQKLSHAMVAVHFKGIEVLKKPSTATP